MVTGAKPKATQPITVGEAEETLKKLVERNAQVAYILYDSNEGTIETYQSLAQLSKDADEFDQNYVDDYITVYVGIEAPIKLESRLRMDI